MKKFSVILLFISFISCEMIYAQNSFPSTGNVKIGTNSNNALLNVGGGGETSTFTVKDDGVGVHYVNFQDADGENVFQIKGKVTNSTLKVILGDVGEAGNSHYFTVTNQKSYFLNGNVGIGTSSPNGTLSVRGSSGGGNIVDFVDYANDGVFRIEGDFETESLKITLGDVDDVLNGNILTIGTEDSYFENGKLGIGITNPKKTLHVRGDYYGKGHIFFHAYEGDGQSGTAYLQARDDSGTTDIDLQLRTQNNGVIDNLMRLTHDGKVGIGTTTPNSLLSIGGGGELGQLSVIGANNGGHIVSFADYDTEPVFEIEGKVADQSLKVKLGDFNEAGNGNQLVIEDQKSYFKNGNVGIGTFNPSSILEVHGPSSGVGTTFDIIDGIEGGSMFQIDGHLAGNFDIKLGDWDDMNGYHFFTVTEQNSHFQNGNVGIRTSTPAYDLDVNGTINATSILVGGQPISGGSSPWTTTGSNISFNSGKVGIGTSSPVAPLHVKGSSSSGTSVTFQDYIGEDVFKIDGNVGGGSLEVLLGDVGEAGNSHFLTVTDENSYFQNGNVGIGTTSPSEKLEVNGNIKATSPSTNVIYYRLLRAPESNLHLDAAIGNDIYLNHYQGNNVRFGPSGNWMMVKNDGNVGIGTTSPSNKLDVAGTIRAEEVKVEAQPWPDYVFSDTYELSDLSEVSDYIDDNGHLPNIPSAKEVEENGIKLGEMNAKLLEKIEELTLYLIEVKMENEQLKSNQKEIMKQLKELDHE